MHLLSLLILTAGIHLPSNESLIEVIPTTRQSKVASSWVITTDLFGNRLHQSMSLTAAGEKLTGEIDGTPIEGSLIGNRFRLVVKGGTDLYEGTLENNAITGEATLTHNPPAAEKKRKFTGRAIPDRPTGGPRRHEFKPSRFSNLFSADVEPVLTIWPGDTVHTTTIDSGGVDEHGVTQALYGNPQTGPFFIGSARQGDVLAVHIKRLRLNRNYADSLDAIAKKARDTNLAIESKDLGKLVRWTIDTNRGVAFPEKATQGLKDFTVPLRPMLGCVGVAPAFGFPAFSTGDCGRFGGNMDLNEITEGVTVYLGVEQPGALLYLGDAHAAQGDGETSEFGLETSMDVEFSVDVIRKKFLRTPRVETPTHHIAVGMSGSLDEALKEATAGLTQWLKQDYNLTTSEIAQIFGSSIQYSISQIVGRNVGITAKLSKERLKGLTPVSKGN